MNLLDKPYRYRNLWIIIKLSVVLYCFLSSKDVKAILYHTFRIKVSHKTICEWGRKFPEEFPKKNIKYEKDETVILFTDEKYVRVKEIKAYWWSIKDHLGNVLSNIVTMSRDAESAKKLFQRAKEKINNAVHAVVHDGLESYSKPVKRIFGRKCKSIVAGIKPKPFMINNKLYWITNNSSESLNAQIDNYYARLHYNFNNLESANYFAEMFLNRKNLRDVCC